MADSTHSASPVPIGKSGGFSRPVGGGIGANTVAKSPPVTRILRLWVSPASRKRRWGPRKAARIFGERRSSGMSEPCRLWRGEGYGACDDESRTPPRRAHDTLQPQDESIIVGYYTSAEVHSPKLPASQPLPCGARKEFYGKRRRYLSYQRKKYETDHTQTEKRAAAQRA